MTVYDYDLHGLGESAFQSFQRRTLAEQSLADDAPAATVASAPASVTPRARPAGGGLMKKLVIGAAVVGATAGVIYLGRCAMSDGRA